MFEKIAVSLAIDSLRGWRREGFKPPLAMTLELTLLQPKALRFPINASIDRSLVPIYYLFGVMGLYILVTKVLYTPHVEGNQFLLPYGLVAAITLIGARVTYETGTRAFAIMLRTILVLFMVYIVASRVQIADVLVANNPFGAFELNFGWMVAFAFGLIGLKRPSFALLPICYMLWQKHQLSYVLGIHIDWMDYFTVIESGTLLVLGIVLLSVLKNRIGLGILTFSSDRSAPRAERINIHPADLLVVLAVALHFGNYFYAGMIKMGLGLQHPMFWVLSNQTQTLLLAAWESGVLPLSFSDALVAGAYTTIDNIKVFTNLVTLVVQLFAVAAIIRMRWAVLTTICYDILHLTIFGLTGIFFWKFIILNIGIVAALTVVRFDDLPGRLKLVFCSIVVLSPAVFQIMPSYAWLDTRSMNSVRVTAIIDDGTEYRVPSNYFLGASVTFAQHRLIWPSHGPVTTETWATTRNHEVMEKGLACEWGYAEGNLPPTSWYVERDRISELVRRHHIQILSMVDEQGRVEYDLFPHHIFSVPWLFSEFDALDKRRIVKYRYENESLCLDFKDGQVTRRTMWSSGFDIPLSAR